jgi:hypothetical protein
MLMLFQVELKICISVLQSEAFGLVPEFPITVKVFFGTETENVKRSRETFT